MSGDGPKSNLPHLVWVCPASPTGLLDGATWLETTRELRRLGWRVTLIAVGSAGKQCIQGVDVLCIPRPEVYFFRQIVFHKRILHTLVQEWDTIDVILFHQMSAPWLLPLRLKGHLKGKRRPLLVMDTRTVPMESRVTARWKDRIRGSFRNMMNRLANHWADGQTAITERMAQLVGIPAQQLWGTWPSGANLERFAPAQHTRRWPEEGELISLVYIGVLHYERNLMALSRAVERANDEGMMFALSLIGEGTGRSDLEQFALGTEGRIRVIPPVPHDQVPSLLAQSHVGVSPFPDEEKYQVSSPIKLFEYMGAGLPVMVTRLTCHTEVIGDGAYAFWAEDASVEGLVAAMRKVWISRNSLHIMGRAAANAAQAWTWQASASKLRAALEYGIALNESRAH